MLLRHLAMIMVLIPLASAWAQPNCVEESHCRSQLIRVEISNSILQNDASSLLPVLKNFAESPTLSALIERDFPISTVAFPQNLENCLREKRSNPLFADIKCEDRGLCGKKLDPQVRELMCFKLPCPIFEGTLHPGTCQGELSIFPNEITFPTPVTIQKIRLTPTVVEFADNHAKLCFMINELSLNMSLRLGLDVTRTKLPDSGINVTNVNPSLDSPREVCMTANVNLGSAEPMTNFTLTTPGDAPFISDSMIRAASQKLQIEGLSGYPADQLERVKGELVPVIFQPVRDSVETALKSSLAQVFQQQMNKLAAQGPGSSSHMVSSQNLMNELGLGNLQIRNQLAITECAALKNAGQPIPPHHPCIGIPFFGTPITPENFDSSNFIELTSLQSLASSLQITSESIKQRLIALKDVLLQEKMYGDNPADQSEIMKQSRLSHQRSLQQNIKDYLDPLIDRISKNQMEGQILNFVEIQDQLQNGFGRNVGVSVPEICSDTIPSPHARREISHCPVQAYVDLNEMNKVLDRMWHAGRLCQQGKGPYVPALENHQQKYDTEGKPIGSGCYMEVGGMGCYLNGAPQIQYDPRSKKYKTSVKLKACYRGPVLLGVGRFGGDFNINFSFTPKACNGGDFCMENPDVNWRVVAGSERFALRPSSFLNDIVTSGIQKAINGAIGDTIRLPLTSGVGPLANIPLEAEGRVDTGPGFFGACLKLRSSGVSGQ